MTGFLTATLDLPQTVDRSPAADVVDAPSDTAAAVADIVSVLVAAALVLLLVTDSDTPLRPPVALVFALFVPGWTIIRMSVVRATPLVAVSGVALSISFMMLLGEALVLFGDWKWFPAGIVVGVACVGLGTVSIFRRRLEDQHSQITWVRPSAGLSTVALVSIGSVVAGNVLVVMGVRRSSIAGIDFLGVLDLLSALYWIGLVVIVCGLVFAVWKGSRWAWMNVGALLVALHGLPGLLQPNPRFGVAWLHTGFARHIAEEGTLLRNLDARFSWAGFFAGGGLLQRLAGTESLLWLVRYSPLFFNACGVVLVALLARRLRATEMQAVVAAALFCCLNWIGQDYFAPQAAGFVLYLTVVLVVLSAFPADPAGLGRFWSRLLRPAPDSFEGIRGRQAVAVLAGCCLVIVAIVVSHQLTPAILFSSLFLLVACRSTRLRVLPTFVAVVFLAWFSYAADRYWLGHFDSLTSSVGQVSNLVNQNVGSRTGSTVFERRVVVGSRIILALVSWGLASVFVVLQWFKRRTPIALACLFVAPFPMLVLQPYGGEMILRVYYFSLPAVAILIALMAVPARHGSTPADAPSVATTTSTGPADGRLSMSRSIGFGVLIALLIPAFITARFGNESFESFSNDDVKLSEQMYEIVPDGSIVFVDTKQSLLYWTRVAEVGFRTLPEGTPAEVTEEISTQLERSPVFVLLSDSQAAARIINEGRPSDWMIELINELVLTGRYQVEAHVGTGVLLRLEPR